MNHHQPDTYRISGVVPDTADLLDSMTRPGWWATAHCRTCPDEVAYLTPTSTETIWFDPAGEKLALMECRKCDHQAACLLSVVGVERKPREGYLSGVFGGMSPNKRMKFTAMVRGMGFLADRQRAPHGTAQRARRCSCNLCRFVTPGGITRESEDRTNESS